MYHDPADGGIVGNLKSELTTEVVLTGWAPGEGRRSGQIGSLLLGAYRPDGHLVYIGHVGTGFTGHELRNLAEQLEPLRRNTSPFDEPVPARSLAARSGSSRAWSARSSTDLTGDHRLRHPSWRGLRPDQQPHDVRWQ